MGALYLSGGLTPGWWRLLLLGLGWLAAAKCVWAQETYTLYVVPQFPPLVVHRDWLPIAEYLSRETGVQFELKPSASIPRFEAALLEGRPDFVYMNPYHQVMARRAHGYVPLLRDAGQPLAGILVVRKDGPIHSVRELAGATLAFPSPNAFGASLYLRALLMEKEGLNVSPNYVQTHANVYRHVLLGLAAAGGGVQHTLDKESADVKGQLRVLYRTPEVAPHPLSAHPRIPVPVREAVVRAMMRLAGSEAGERQLRVIQIPKPVRADYGRDYAPLESLGLDKYVVLGID